MEFITPKFMLNEVEVKEGILSQLMEKSEYLYLKINCIVTKQKTNRRYN